MRTNHKLFEEFALKHGDDLHHLTDIFGLVNAVNCVSKDYMLSKVIFSEDLLVGFSANNSVASKGYRKFYIPKKSGGVRAINAPNHQLKYLQECLNVLFMTLFSPSHFACGFLKGKSVIDNAVSHVGKNYILNIDLQDFFSSISLSMVKESLLKSPFLFPEELASLISELICIHDEDGNSYLPQGAPSSPFITNVVVYDLDNRLGAFSCNAGVNYSRYADDMTFSASINMFQQEDPFFQHVKTFIKEAGFVLNEKKTRVCAPGQRHEVTGLVVDSKVNVSRDYIKDIRAILKNWEVSGYDYAYIKFMNYYNKSRLRKRISAPNMINIIGGKLNYLRVVRGVDDAVYIQLENRFKSLISCSTSMVESYSIDDFKEKFKLGPLILYNADRGRVIKWDYVYLFIAKSLVLDGPKKVVYKHKGKFSYWLMKNL